MSDKPAAETKPTTEKQEQVMKYLKDHKVNEELNVIVNKVCKELSPDPYSAMAAECLLRAQPVKITKLKGREVLDSRGNPTVETDVICNYIGVDRLVARASGPSGASTGSNEAHELRDTDNKTRYLGKGTQTAVKHVDNELNDAVKGKDVTNLKELDNILIQADGTRLKTKLGGNAITATSFALAEAGAFVQNIELFQHLHKFWVPADKQQTKFSLPRPMVNIINGGKHAGGDLQVQEFMIVPSAKNTFKENLRIVTEVYHHLGKILVSKYGVSAKNLGDEGGYAPSLSVPTEALGLIEQAIESAGYKVGEDVFLALDCAASEYYNKENGTYEVEKGKHLDDNAIVEYYVKLRRAHPALISIEDPLDEKDYSTWIKLTEAFTKEFPGIMIVGDDLYTTNTDLIQKGVSEKWANALLLKVNQIGTISESMDAARMIFNDNGQVIVSHRSGETSNTLISDLAVAINAGFIKTGATARGERVAKYNRLLAIEEYLQEHDMLAPHKQA